MSADYTGTTAPSIFESFNARALTPELLAEIFIPNEEFSAVAKRRHSVIVGPRGSGKTSMLKMLQPTALHCWKHEAAAQFRASVDFIGVYVPCDVSWRQQLESIGAHVVSPDFQEAMQRGVLTAHLLFSLSNTLLDLRRLSHAKESRYFGLISSSCERTIVRMLSSRWNLKPDVDSFSSLRLSVSSVSAELLRFANQERFLPGESRGERFASNPHLTWDFLGEMTYAIEVLNSELGVEHQKWAFLFDELEIAPTWLVHRLYGAFRSIDQRIILKLSLSPYTHLGEFSNKESPQQADDFDSISLVFGYKNDARDFCVQLFKSFLASEEIHISDPKEVLGPSALKAGMEERGRAYKRGSTHYNLLKKAQARDRSFRDYCERNKIDSEELSALPREQLASLVRKIMPTLLIRTTFRRPDSSQSAAQKRSRKNPDIYGGADTFFEMLEANPRWLIGVTSELLPTIKQTGRVSAAKQVESINRAAGRFATILNTIPLSNKPPFNVESLLNLLSAAAEKIHRSIALEEFTPEPFGSFVIDEGVPMDLVDALGVALNAGALVTVANPMGGEFGTNIRTARVRITYLLSALFQNPVRLGREFKLSEVISSLSVEGSERQRTSRRKRSESQARQLRLDI
jgi:hypothetical protein